MTAHDDLRFNAFADRAIQAQVAAARGLEEIANPQMSAVDAQWRTASALLSDVFGARDLPAMRNAWAKGDALQRDGASRAATVVEAMLEVGHRTAASMVAAAGNSIG